MRHLSAAIPFTPIIVINTTLQSNYLKNIKKFSETSKRIIIQISGKEWAGTSQFQEFSDLPARLFFQFYQEHKDLIYALNKIKTDKVDMDQFVSQLFRERYLCAPSNQTRQNPERNLELEAEIYASVYNAIAHYYSFSGSNVTLPIPHMEEALCHVFLYSIGIIEKHCEEVLFPMSWILQNKRKKEKKTTNKKIA